MFYYPNGDYKGVNYPTPLYYQYYYSVGEPDLQNSLKCTLFSQISGYYAKNKIAENAVNYMNSMTSKYWNDGMTVWLANMSRIPNTNDSTKEIDQIKELAKNNLKDQKPFIVGAQNAGGIQHMVLVVGYKNQGNATSDFIVLDSCQTKFSNLDAFFKSFPNRVNGSTWQSITGGTGYVYGEY